MSDRPKPDIRVCEIATDGSLGKQLGPSHASRRSAERWISKYVEADGKQLLIVKVVRRIKLVQKPETVIHTTIEDAPPV